MSNFAKLAVAAIAVVALVTVVGLGARFVEPPPVPIGGDATPTQNVSPSASPSPPEPLTWSPERLAEDWPAPVRLEPAGGAVVTPMEPADDAHWDPGERLWEPFAYADPVGDVDGVGVGWVDLREIRLSSGWTRVFGLRLAAEIPRPIADPADQWIAYGVVLDTNGDGTADVRVRDGQSGRR
jgi:hypothetical protein